MIGDGLMSLATTTINIKLLEEKPTETPRLEKAENGLELNLSPIQQLINGKTHLSVHMLD